MYQTFPITDSDIPHGRFGLQTINFSHRGIQHPDLRAPVFPGRHQGPVKLRDQLSFSPTPPRMFRQLDSQGLLIGPKTGVFP